MQVRAPAKINLNLRVLGKNPSTGFHDIETWMTPITLADDIRIETTSETGIQLSCGGADLPEDEGNLAWRAADLFRRTTKIPGGVRMELQKNIPHGAGLGGGSSNAAAVLTALNSLHGSPLDDLTLISLAAQLGSDVPFFLLGLAGLATGRGEKLEDKPLIAPLDLFLIKPPFGVETAWAYRQWSSDVKVPAEWIAPQLHGTVEIFNDLERPVFHKFIQLPVMKEWLLKHSLVAAAGMSGSGSCLFAILHDTRGADALAEEVKTFFGPTFWTASCQTCG